MVFFFWNDSCSREMIIKPIQVNLHVNLRMFDNLILNNQMNDSERILAGDNGDDKCPVDTRYMLLLFICQSIKCIKSIKRIKSIKSSLFTKVAVTYSLASIQMNE